MCIQYIVYFILFQKFNYLLHFLNVIVLSFLQIQAGSYHTNKYRNSFIEKYIFIFLGASSIIPYC